MAPVIAVLLARAGASVTYVTTTRSAGERSHYTGEQKRKSQLLELGVEVRVSTTLEGFDGSAVTLGCVYSGRQWQQGASTVVLVTSREPREELLPRAGGRGACRARAAHPADR